MKREKGTATDLLNELASVKRCITQRELSKRLGWTYTRVRSAMQVLQRREMVERVHPDCYRATAAGCAAAAAGKKITNGPTGKHTGRTPTPQNKLRARLWRAMRKLVKFSINDLLINACTEREAKRPDLARAAAGQFLAALKKAEYVRVLSTREPSANPRSHGAKRYFLLPDMNTGPLAPQVRRSDGKVYDPNRRTWFPPGTQQ